MKKKVAILGIIALLVVPAVGVWYFLQPSAGHSDDLEMLVIGKMPIEAHALIYIAEDQGFFEKNGLNVTITDYPTGPAAIEGLMNGDVDIAGAGEYVVVENALHNENISIIASIDRYQYFSIVGRRDRGIEEIPDLKGKRIGVARKTAGEFFLGRSLNLHGVSIDEVVLVDVPHSQCVDAIDNGSIDALTFISPYADEITDRLGETGVVWPAQSGQLLYSMMVCRNDWIASHTETTMKFLRSLADAEILTLDHPVEARAIVQQRLNYTDDEIATVWSNNQYSLTLDQALIIAMEDEARWMIENNLTNVTTIPDFREYIASESLEQVAPHAVHIIG